MFQKFVLLSFFPTNFLENWSSSIWYMMACFIYQEREERRRRLKRERSDDRPMHASQPHGYDYQSYQTKTLKSYDKSRLPPGKSICLFWHLDLVVKSINILILLDAKLYNYRILLFLCRLEICDIFRFYSFFFFPCPS